MNRILSIGDREQMIESTSKSLLIVAIVWWGFGILLGLGGVSVALKEGLAAFTGGNHVVMFVLLYVLGLPVLLVGAYGLRKRTSWSRMGAFSALAYLAFVMAFAGVNGSLYFIALAISSAFEAYVFYTDAEIKALLDG